MHQSPSPNGPNGDDRDNRGRFAPGNPGGPGNPHARRVGQLRAALIDTLTIEDTQEIARVLIDKAKDGDLAAMRELFLRVLGRPVELDLLERIEMLEQALCRKGTA